MKLTVKDVVEEIEASLEAGHGGLWEVPASVTGLPSPLDIHVHTDSATRWSVRISLRRSPDGSDTAFEGTVFSSTFLFRMEQHIERAIATLKARHEGRRLSPLASPRIPLDIDQRILALGEAWAVLSGRRERGLDANDAITTLGKQVAELLAARAP